MKSWSGGIVLAVVAVAIAASVWLASDRRTRAQRADGDVARLQSEVASARAEAAAATDQVDALNQRVSALKKRLAAPDPRLEVLRRRLRATTDPTRALVPAGAEVVHVQRLEGAAGEPPRVAVTWRKGAPDLPRRSGVFVWEPAGGELLEPGTPHNSQLAFGINLVANRRVTSGPPSSPVTSRAAALYRTGIIDARDVTGDGYRDLLTVEASTGSGGCGTWRVLAASDGSMRQIFRRATCEADIRITGDGLLKIRQAFRTPGCPSVHGCANRFTTLQWNGDRWVRVSRRVADK